MVEKKVTKTIIIEQSHSTALTGVAWAAMDGELGLQWVDAKLVTMLQQRAFQN